MFFHVGDYVSRNSYQNDTIFKIVRTEGDNVYLKGINIRLLADSKMDDLRLEEKSDLRDDVELYERMENSFSLDRSEYFYLAGKVVHFDGDCCLSK